jgi:hypothetical protein
MAGSASTGHPGVIAGRNTTTETPDDIGMDQDSRALFVALWAWNTSTVAWEKVADINSKLDTIIAHLEQIETNTTP